MFPEFILDLLAVCKNGDVLRAKDMQEKLSSAVVAVIKHGKYHFLAYDKKHYESSHIK